MKVQKKLDFFINGFKVVNDLGIINGNRCAEFACNECPNSFVTQVTNIMRRKKRDCGCKPVVLKSYQEINGFKIIRDDGRIGRKRLGRAICKVCNKEFECNLYQLHDLSGCGCHPKTPLPKLEKFVNGFEVLEDLGRMSGNRRIKVKCKVCQKEFDGQVQNLKVAKSCGCLKGKEIVCSYKQSHARLFRIYKNMVKRCYDEKHKSFHNYGKRGIKVCWQWLDSPDDFCSWALNNGYQEELSLDRVNGLKGYEPENCRWITVTEQNRNARSNVLNKELVKMIRSEDRSKMKIQEIADKYNLPRTTISSVLNYYTWIEIK